MRVLWMAILFFCMVNVCQADELLLRSGRTLEGKIVEKTDKYVKFDEGVGIVLTYYDDEIDSINGNPVIRHKKRVIHKRHVEPLVTPPETPTLPVPAISPVTDVAPTHPAQDPPSMVTGASTINSQPNSEVSTPVIVPTAVVPTPAFPKQINARTGPSFNAAVLSKVMGVVFLFIVFLYVLHYCIPTFMIAKNLNVENPWMAWVPLVNIYLTCKIAGRPGWWLLLSLIPLVGIVIFVILWMDIADKCHKPRWSGILVIVPFISLIFIWYLALSKPTPTIKL